MEIQVQANIQTIDTNITQLFKIIIFIGYLCLHNTKQSVA